MLASMIRTETILIGVPFLSLLMAQDGGSRQWLIC